MKKLLACIGLITLLYSCKTNNAGSPKGTVNAFIEASKSGNIAEIKKYITKSDASLLEIGESFISKLDPNAAKDMKDNMSKEFNDKASKAKIEIKDEKIDGDKATVDVEFIYDGKTENRPFSLIKEDGVWKISLLSTGMKNAGANQQDEMKAMNMDSLKGAISKGMEEFNKMDKDSVKKVMEGAMKELEKLKDIPNKNQ
jgi:Domain of unknown function (DUF4878)